ncbi:MAG: MFS transporter [Lachnospiraceae bacterium]|nr:MFS transporter [Lachnospiraceae bacterium]
MIYFNIMNNTQNNWKKVFYTIWVGQAISQLTSSILQFAMIWYLTDTTRSGIMLSLSVMMAFLPQGILGFFTGVFIDRFNRKRIMISADLFIAAVSLLLVFVSVDGTIPPVVILVVLCCRAVGTAFHEPTLGAITPQIVPDTELTRCAGYTQSLESVSMIISPALAAILYANWNMNGIVMMDVAGAVLAVLAVIVVPIPKQKVQHREDNKIHLIRESKEGFQIIKKEKGLLGIVLITSLYSMALMPVSALFPLMSMEYFGGTSVHASIVETLFSVGYLVGALILAKWGGTENRVYTIALSYFMMAAALVGTFLLPVTAFAVFVFLAWIMGVSGPFYWGTYTPLLQVHFREEYLGRVLSITDSIRFIIGPVALVISGFIADLWGNEKWFLIAGITVFLCATLLLTIPSVRMYDAN